MISQHTRLWVACRGKDYQLCVEFGQPGLARIIEDEDCVDHAVMREDA